MKKQSKTIRACRLVSTTLLILPLLTAAVSLARADECRANRFQPTFVRHDSLQPRVYYVEPNGNFTLMNSPAEAQATCRARGVRQLIGGGSCFQRNWGDFGCGCNITPSPNQTCARFQALVVAPATRGAATAQFCRDLYARGDAENRAGNVARDQGNLAGARFRYQQALALFRQGAADPRCAQFRAQFANAVAIVERNLQRVAGGMRPPPTPSPVNRNIVGSWRGCDGRILTFSFVNGQYLGRYTALGGLGSFRFTVGEVGVRLHQQPDGRYVGEVKWRWSNGNQQWKPTTITISGNALHDTGGDSCGRTMTRVN